MNNKFCCSLLSQNIGYSLLGTQIVQHLVGVVLFER